MSFTGGSLAWRLPIACQTLFAFVRGSETSDQSVTSKRNTLMMVADGHLPRLWYT